MEQEVGNSTNVTQDEVVFATNSENEVCEDVSTETELEDDDDEYESTTFQDTVGGIPSLQTELREPESESGSGSGSGFGLTGNKLMGPTEILQRLAEEAASQASEEARYLPAARNNSNNGNNGNNNNNNNGNNHTASTSSRKGGMPRLRNNNVRVKTQDMALETEKNRGSETMRRYRELSESQKIFSFSVPFGQKYRNPSASNLNRRRRRRREVSNEVTESGSSRLDLNPLEILEDDVNTMIRRDQLRNKLMRTNSLSSVEERELYRGQKHIENVRNIAIKESLPLRELKRSIKLMSLDPEEKRTHDGYLYRRLHSIWYEISGDFIIMGGYRGSVLRDATTSKLLWVPLRAGLNLRKINLVIGPNDEANIRDHVVPDGMLTHIGPVDICRKLIRKLASNSRVNIQDFGYDWRLSLDILAEELKERLEANYERQKTNPMYGGKPRGTFIIAHSMGGLIAHKVLQEHTHLIRGIIYVGCPAMCPSILSPFRFGDEIMFNKTILSKEANFFMRSSYCFLPLNGKCFVDRDTDERYNIDFFDPEVWKILGLSPLVSEKREKSEGEETIVRTVPTKSKTSTTILDIPLISPVTPLLSPVIVPTKIILGTLDQTTRAVMSKVPIVGKTVAKGSRDDHDSSGESSGGYSSREGSNESLETKEFDASFEESYDYLVRTLKRTKNFLESLEYKESKDYPPLVIVYGNKIPTVAGSRVKGVKGIVDGDYSDLYYGPGDGVVHYRWLLPEKKGFPVTAKIASPTGHVSLMTDMKSMAKALISIFDEEKARESPKSGDSS